MSEIPETLVLRRHRDLVGRRKAIWVRRGVIALLGAFLVAGLAGTFGQRPDTFVSRSRAATLELRVPSRLRGGLLYEARFTIRAHRTLKDATLQLSPGWAEGMQINTIEPGPTSETSRDGQIVLTLGKIPAGELHTLFMQFQVNPTNVGHRAARVALYDGSRRLVTIDRHVTVFP
jgi:hypothetical protein